MVSVLSDDHVYYLDPHERIFPDPTGRKTFSYPWNLIKFAGEAGNFASQWEPMIQGIFNVSRDVFLQGKRYKGKCT